jgi:hypothetical protein
VTALERQWGIDLATKLLDLRAVVTDYDTAVLADGPKAYWPLNDKDAVTYDDYDTAVLNDSPKAYWPLDDIDTV